MVMPMWLSALGAAGAGLDSAYKKKLAMDQQKRIAELLGRGRNGGLGQTPASTGAGLMGPQNWGANNTQQGGVISDQWGNPIGPAAAGSYGGGTPLAGMDPSSIGSTAQSLPSGTTDLGANAFGAGGGAPTPSTWQAGNFGMNAQQPVPYTSGTLGATGGLSGPMNMAGGVDPMSALFSSGGFGLQF